MSKKNDSTFSLTARDILTKGTLLRIRDDASPDAIIAALKQCHDDHMVRWREDRADAERKIKEVNRIIERLNFIANARAKRRVFTVSPATASASPSRA